VDRAGVDERDPLTGLANRRAFHEALLEVDGLADHDRPVSIVLADVFHFRDVNDVHGHRFGDGMLQVIGDLLRRAVPEATVVARIGGDEFGLLLDGFDEEDAATIAGDLRAAVRHHPGYRGCRFLLSVGHAAYPPAPTLGRAFQLADRRLFEARGEPLTP
jgi:diguanylate cyclase